MVLLGKPKVLGEWNNGRISKIMIDNSGIKILLTSDCDYEELVAEIYFNGKFIALLNQDEGIDKLKIEFPGLVEREELVLRKVDLEILEKGIELAKQRLIE